MNPLITTIMDTIDNLAYSWKLVALMAIILNLLLGLGILLVYKMRYQNGLVDGAGKLCEEAGRQLPFKHKETLLNYYSTIVYQNCPKGLCEPVLEGVRVRMFSKCKCSFTQKMLGDGCEICNHKFNQEVS